MEMERRIGKLDVQGGANGDQQKQGTYLLVQTYSIELLPPCIQSQIKFC